MLRFILSVLSVFVACPGFTIAATDTKSDTALRFAYDTGSFISYSPNVNSLTEKFSVCVWVRKFQSGNYPIAFAYNGWELALGDSGYYNRLFSSNSLGSTLTSKFTPTANTWYLYCSTWSLASRTFRVYVNGQQVGTMTTPSGRRLQTGGALTLGNYSPNQPQGLHYFGGMLHNFNMYSKELTATEVAALSSAGFCAEIPEQLEEYRVIKWEDVLKLSRSGTVLDEDTRCAAFVELSITRKKMELAVTEKGSLELSLNGVQERFNSTQEELVGVQERFNSTQEELVGVRRELEATEGELNETRTDLQEIKMELRNLTESKCALKKGNLTKWDMFYSPEYYNKTFTHTLYQQLTSTWDSISNRLFGMMITDKVIELIKDLDDDQIDHCGELS